MERGQGKRKEDEGRRPRLTDSCAFLSRHCWTPESCQSAATSAAISSVYWAALSLPSSSSAALTLASASLLAASKGWQNSWAASSSTWGERKYIMIKKATLIDINVCQKDTKVT